MVEVLFDVVAMGGKAEESSDTTYLVHRIKALTDRFQTKHILLFPISKWPRFIFLQRCGQSRNRLAKSPPEETRLFSGALGAVSPNQRRKF